MVPAGRFLAPRRAAAARGRPRSNGWRNHSCFSPGGPISASEIGRQRPRKCGCIVPCQDRPTAMTLDPAPDDWWPPQRLGEIDYRVIAAIHGAYHAVTRRLDVATRQHGLDASEALVIVAVLRDPGCSPGQVRARIGLHRSTLFEHPRPSRERRPDPSRAELVRRTPLRDPPDPGGNHRRGDGRIRDRRSGSRDRRLLVPSRAGRDRRRVRGLCGHRTAGPYQQPLVRDRNPKSDDRREREWMSKAFGIGRSDDGTPASGATHQPAASSRCSSARISRSSAWSA